MPSLQSVQVTSVDDRRLVLLGTEDRVLDVCMDGRRVWSFWLLRDTEADAEAAAGGEAGDEALAPRQVAWPGALRRHLNGTTSLSVRDHVTGTTVYEAEHRFGTGDTRIAVVGRNGTPLALDKSNRLTATFDARSASDVEPLLDAIQTLIGVITDAGVDVFPAYGTLLGAVREGTFLGHDSDADLAYLSRHDRPVDVVRESFWLQRLIAGQGFETYRYSGAAFRVDVREGDGVVRGLDVFAGFLDDDQLYVMGEIGTSFRREWVLPLGTCTLAGRTFPAPARPEKWLEATYGPGWQVPDPAFKFETSERTIAQLSGWFRGTAPRRQAWERTYSRSRTTLPSRRPSRLARVVLRDVGSAAAAGTSGTSEAADESAVPVGPLRVLDVGAGRGQDGWFLARKGIAVTAYDFVTRGSAAVETRTRKRGLDYAVRHLNLTEWRSVLAEGARVSREPARHVVLARHVADATDAFGRDALFRFASMTCRGGGRIYLDVWTGRGRAPRKLDPLPLAELVALAERSGAAILSATELAPFADGKHQHSIGRLVARWD